MDFLTVDALTLPLATAVGAFGGFPAAPKVFQDLAANMWFQWLMVFVLVWQGGSGQNATVAAVATVVLFLVAQVLDMVYTRESF
jgi:hypothetical protein